MKKTITVRIDDTLVKKMSKLVKENKAALRHPKTVTDVIEQSLVAYMSDKEQADTEKLLKRRTAKDREIVRTEIAKLEAK